MSGLRKFLGLSDEDAELAKRLASPADMAAQGAASLGESAGRTLGGLGAKLDARLGTTGYRDDEASPDVFRTRPESDPIRPGGKLDKPGLFEMLGGAVPNVIATLGGNALPVSGPAMPGAVAAFPTPKQSFARMKDEAVLRDMLESRGARAMDVVPDPVKMPGPWLDPPAATAIEDAALANYRAARSMKMMPAMTVPPLNTSEFAFRPGTGRGPGRTGVMPTGKSAAVPRSLDLDGQSELERYLAGLYGPRAPK